MVPPIKKFLTTSLGPDHFNKFLLFDKFDSVRQRWNFYFDAFRHTLEVYTLKVYTLKVYTLKVYTLKVYTLKVYTLEVYIWIVYTLEVWLAYALEKCILRKYVHHPYFESVHFGSVSSYKYLISVILVKCIFKSTKCTLTYFLHSTDSN